MSNITINTNLCVHCGACTAVCSVSALNIHPMTAELSFTQKKCTKCAQCIDVCPLRAIHFVLITDTCTAISE